MNLKEFNEFFHFFRSEIKLYPIGYNILVGYGIYTITDIIWVIGMDAPFASSWSCLTTPTTKVMGFLGQA